MAAKNDNAAVYAIDILSSSFVDKQNVTHIKPPAPSFVIGDPAHPIDDENAKNKANELAYFHKYDFASTDEVLKSKKHCRRISDEQTAVINFAPAAVTNIPPGEVPPWAELMDGLNIMNPKLKTNMNNGF